MENNEQWLKGGNCSECRKQKYCSKSCKAHDKYMDRMFTEAFTKTSPGKILKQINTVLDSKEIL